jgi:adenine-specific DNA methylase
MDPEFQLRELMLIDAKVFRTRNQIADRTDPQTNKKLYRSKAKTKKPAKVEPDDIPTEEPPK